MNNLDGLFTPVKNQRVYAQIVEQILDLINRGEYQPGMQLPIERDLAKMFGVSRPTLREALTVLQMMGFIETVPGQGTFISKGSKSETNSQELKRILNDESPIMTMKARMAFEPSVATEAAHRRSKESLQKLDKILEPLRNDPVNGGIQSDIDRSFHLELAVATGNPVLIQMQTVIFDLMGQTLWTTMIRNTWGSSPTFWEEGLQEHISILEAVRRKDALTAGKCVREHLQRVEQVMVSAEISARGNTSD